MFKKIIWQLIVSYFLVIIISMVFIGLILFRSAEAYLVASLESSLSFHARIISRMWEGYFMDKPPSVREERSLRLLTEGLAWQSAGRITVCDAKETVIMDVGQTSVNVPERSELFRDALRGKEGSVTHTSATKSGFARISVCYPIKTVKSSQKGEEVVGAVLVTGSLAYTREILMRMSREYGLGIVMSTMILLLFSVLFSMYISNPIIQLTMASKRMARGDLISPVKIKRKDEIGELSVQFEHMRLRLKDTLEEFLKEEEKLQAVLSHMADGVIVFDNEGQIMMANGSACAFMGCYTLEDVRKRFGQDLIPFCRLKELLHLTLQTQASGVETMKGFTGGRIMKLNYSSIGSDRGVQGVIFLLHDITELSMLDEMRTDFVSNVSHELKTPLASIKGFAELLMDGALDDKKMSLHFLSCIDKEVDRLTRMVKSLLDLSKMDSGLVKFDSDRINLSLICEDIVSRFSVRSKERNIGITMEIEPDVFVYANADRIQQVLINLVDNAIRYSPNDSQVLVRLVKEEGGARVHVIDWGSGIAEPDCHRVFERFYRVDKARSREQGGSGLGLAIVKQLIEAMGGSVGVRSKEGEGSDFYFTI